MLVVTPSGQADPPTEPAIGPAFTGKPGLRDLYVGGDAHVDTSALVGSGTIDLDCQWQAAGDGATPGSWSDISGATDCEDYTIPSGQDAHWLRAEITASNSEGEVTVRSHAYRVGGQIVYMGSMTGMAIMNPDGTNNRAVGVNCGTYCRDLAVSPDGSLIAFSATITPDQTNALWVASIDGRWQKRVAAIPGHNLLVPSWSPDSKRIAYTDATTESIHVVDAEGANDTMIKANAYDGDGNWDERTRPQWHPTDGYIYFGYSSGLVHCRYHSWATSQTWYANDLAACGSITNGEVQTRRDHEIARIRPDGSGFEVVLADDVTSQTEWDEDMVSWHRMRMSPDGSKIYAGNHCESTCGGTGENGYLLTTSGMGFTQVADSLDYGGTLAWSPFSNRILLIHLYGGLWKWGQYPVPHAQMLGTGASVAADGGVAMNGLGGGGAMPFDWGNVPSTATPALPLEQTFGSDLAPNAGDDSDVNASTGSYRTEATDISLPGFDNPFSFARVYNSADPAVGDLGPGWQHTYSAKLTVNGTTGDVTARAGDAQQLLFIKQADGSYAPASGGLSALVEHAGGDYTLTRYDGQELKFSAAGKLTSVVSPNEHTIALGYDGGGNLDTITDATGRVVDVSWNVAGSRITKLELADGRHVDFGYDGSNRLGTVTDLRGKVWTYAYDSTSARLASIKDPNNHWVVRNTYSGDRLVSQLDPLNNETTWSSSTSAGVQTVTITDPAGKVWKKTFVENVITGITDPEGAQSAFGYDEDLNPTLTIGPDGRSETVYNTRGDPIGFNGSGGETGGSVYDAQHNVTGELDTEGHTLKHSYDANGNETSQEATNGRTVSATYDADGLLETQTDARGKTTTFDNDADGNQTSVTTPEGHETTTSYDAYGRVTGVVKPRGNVVGADPNDYTTSFTYDAGDLKLTETDELGKTTTFTYDDVGNLETVTNALSKTWTYDYDAANRRVKETDDDGGEREVTYDSRSNVVAETDPVGNESTFGYTDANRRAWVVTPRGNVTGATPADYKTQFVYDASGNLVKQTDPLGNETLFTYDGRGRTSKVVGKRYPSGTVPPFGTPILDDFNRANGSMGADWTTLWLWSGSGFLEVTGNQVSNVGSSSTSGSSRYEALGPLTDSEAYVTVATPNDWTRVYARLQTGAMISGYEAQFGGGAVYVGRFINGSEVNWFVGNATLASGDKVGIRVIGSTISAWVNTGSGWTKIGEHTDTTYASGYLGFGQGKNTTTGVVDAFGGGIASGPLPPVTRTVAEYTYDNADRVLTEKDAAGETTSFAYDEFGRRISVTDKNGKTTSYAYDSNDNLTSVVSPLGNTQTFGYDDDNRRIWSVSPRGNVGGATPDDYKSAFEYDADGNVASQTDPLGHETSWTYDRAGRKTSETDPNNHTTEYGYDDAGHLTGVTDPLENETAYTYDDLGRIDSRTDARGHVTSYDYDLAGRLTSLVKPGPTGTQTRTWTYQYDAEGHRTSMVDANGSATVTPTTDGKTDWTYDRLGRLTAIAYSDSTPDVGFTYDLWGNRVSMNDGEANDETYSYDEVDRLTSVTRDADVFGYEYDDAGNVTKRTYPDGTVLDYTYDNDGRMASVKVGGSTIATYGYNADGLPTSATLPAGNGYVETRSYDRAGRLSEIKNTKSGTDLSRFAYIRDAVGNPTRIDKVASAVETYEYDELDRLTEVCYQAAACSGGSDPFIRWTYDEVGNRLTEERPAGTTTYDYDNADQLTSETTGGTTTNYSYDANGNQTAKGSRTFAYDLADRLASTTAAGTTITYGYDGDGKRLSAADGTSTTRYLWDRNSALAELALERDGAGSLIRRYHHGLDLLSMRSGGDDFYYHRDGLGSIANVTDAAGATQWTYEYEPYGAERTANGATGAPVNPMRFTAEHLDSDTGLYHLRARQYDPAAGRFVSTDPAPPEVSDPFVSAYMYVSARPTLLTDPTGLCFGCEFLLGVAETGWGAATGTYDLVRHPRQFSRQLKQAYQDAGGGWQGVLNAVNQLNPGYHALLSGDSCLRGSGLDGTSSRGKACGAAVTNGLLLVGAALSPKAGRSAVNRFVDHYVAAKARARITQVVNQLRRGGTVRRHRNIAMMVGEVDGQLIDWPAISGPSHEGTINLPHDRMFTPSEVGGYLRNKDAEYKLLERLQSHIGDNRQAQGRIVLYTERKMCKSCRNVLSQFRSAYPNVRIIVKSKNWVSRES